MKKGRLSKDELVYIQAHAKDGAEKIAKKLDRSVELITKNLPETALPPTEGQVSKSLGRKREAVVYTQGASEAADDFRKTIKPNRKINSAIQPLR